MKIPCFLRIGSATPACLLLALAWQTGDTSRASTLAYAGFCIACNGHRNDPSLENWRNFHNVNPSTLKFMQLTF